MKTLTSSPLLAFALVATQLFGPAVLWAAEQRGIRLDETRRVVVAAISGDQLTAQNSDGSNVLHFRDAVNVGDQMATGSSTTAEVLIGHRAVVLLDHDTAAQLITVNDEQTTVQVTKGLVRVAAAASALGKQGMITVQTPTGQVQTRGGIVRVLVEPPVGVAMHRPIGAAQPYLASYESSPTVAALTPRSELIQVEEGTAEILVGVDGKAMTVPAGQAVTIQSGQAGAISKFVNQDGLRPGVLAIAGHSQTPKEGRDNLVAVQVAQATALGNALTGASETGNGPSGKKEDNRNVINGATGGVTLASASSSLVNSLFGGGSAANPGSSNPTNTTGSGYGGNNNNGNFQLDPVNTNLTVNGGNALLVFTRKDPVQSYVKETIMLDLFGVSMTFNKDSLCGEDCLRAHDPNNFGNVGFRSLLSIPSEFTVKKEVVLVGGTPNIGHGGIAPTETLIVRGAAPSADVMTVFTNVAANDSISTSSGFTSGNGLFPTDRFPAKIGLFRSIPEIATANSTFVVKTTSIHIGSFGGFTAVKAGGTLGQFSNLPDLVPIPNANHGGIATEDFEGVSHVDGAITATSSSAIPIVNLTGGATLDQGTKATIGKTTATDNYFSNPNHNIPSPPGVDAPKVFNGSLLSVIDGPNNGITTSVTVRDRLIGVYDGSTINFNPADGNKALLSVLDAKLKGPAGSIPLIDIAAGSHFDRQGVVTRGSAPKVTVTSALVTRSTIPLDGALLEASAPLFALTRATMTTTSHFADLAGKQAPSLLLNDSLVALNASQLTIQKGNLLNLNAATATVNGYLFSLNNGSTLTLTNGALFSATNGSALNLTANAFGVFGGGANTLSIDNNLCTATCFQLVNSANQPILVNGTPLQVAGATENVVLPNGFNVFALAPGAPTPNINIGANDALFKVDGTSTLTINGTQVQ
jgi:hypothetical protein